MGTYWNAHALLPDDVSEGQMEDTILSAFSKVISQMNHWDSSSELSRYNAAPADTWHRVSPEFFLVLSRALQIAHITAGAFDPTLGKIVDLYGFGPAELSPVSPDSPEIDAARSYAGWEKIITDDKSLSIFQPGQIELDLSSIAKGFAIDLAAEALKSLGVGNFLLEIGGEFRGEGCKANGKPWWVELERPSSSADTPQTLAALCGLSLATSGDTVRRRIIDGEIYTHLIDPQTCRPALNKLCCVTVLARTCMEADAWATALFILGVEKGMELAENQNLAAYFSSHNNGSHFEKWSSSYSSLME